ncbi:hypothetical protein ACN4EG_06965 [Alkalinema pantanalense CENA528]|uniref:hypothetical protein n=1 Tax=Alkalinema pantanalense TaxID=1620705 RepID=UPI003D6E0C99
MYFQKQSAQWLLKMVSHGTLAIALLLGSTNLATAETRSQSVDRVTDWLFNNVNPELNRRKLRSNEQGYIREWQAIREVVEQGLRYEKSSPNDACGTPDWYYPNKDEALKERLADAIFYSRYPQRQGKPIHPNDRTAVQEWLKLKRAMNVAYC